MTRPAPEPAAEPPDPPEDVRPTLVTYLLLTAAVLVPFLLMVRPYVVSVATGGILAVLCFPTYARLRRWLPAPVAGVLVTLGVVLLVVAPVVLVLGAGFKQASVLLERWSAGDAPTLREVAEHLRAWLPYSEALGSPSEVRGMLQEGLTSASAAASRFILGQVTLVPAMVVQIAIVVLSTYFLLVDGRRLFMWVASKVPVSKNIRATLATSFQSATSSVVLASIAAAGAQSGLVLVGFLALGVPMASLGAVAAFIMGWIPTVGPAPVWASAALYLYLQGSTGRAVAMLGVGLLVGISDNIVRPLVLRGRQEMHPLVSLLAILGGIAFMGVPGVFLGPLLAALVVTVLDIWPAVAHHCGIPVTGAGEHVPEISLLGIEPEVLEKKKESA